MEDLEQVKKDVYQNFSSIAKLLITYLYACGYYDKRHIMRIIGLSLTFKLILKLCEGKKASNFKLILKLSRGKKVVVNRSYVDILMQLEATLCYSNLSLSYTIYPNRHLYQKVSKVLSNTTKWGKSTYMIDEVESVLELARSNYFKVDDLPHTDTLLIKFLQFSKDYWLTNHNHENLPELFNCVEAVIDTIIKKLWDESNIHDDNSYICKAILKVLVLLVKPGISTPTLTHELLINYVRCIQLILNNLTDPTKYHQLMVLNKELCSMVPLPNGQENLFGDDYRIQLQAVAWNIASLIYSEARGNLMQKTRCLINSDFMGTTRNLLQLHNLTEEVSGMKRQFCRTIIKRLMPASPHTNLFGFLNFVTENMKELISCNLDTILVWKDEFQEIHKGVIFFRSFLQKIPPTYKTCDASQALCTRIRNAAYEAEYLMDSFSCGDFPVSHQSFLSDLVEEIEVIKTECTMIVFHEELILFTDSSNNAIQNVSSSKSTTKSTTTSTTPKKYPVQSVNVVVGFEKHIDMIMDQLTGNSKERDVVSITGIPGLGKTTLAKTVYEHPYTVNHFQYRAWCCVSQDYRKRKVLLTILRCLAQGNNGIHKKSDEDLSEMLHKELFGRRYLIVIDDVWMKDALEDLQRFFPDNHNGSRLMLTSRDKLVGSPAKYHLELNLLSEGISWALLEQKVYPKEKCPLELCQVGKKIAQKCKGLPLAIVMVAGILLKSDEKLECWEQVAENLHNTLNSQQHGLAVLNLSYDFLPEHLKPLFLYIGAFPEDKVISTETLKYLWIAEGFVQKTDGNRSLEDEVEINLMELTYRNMVMVAERKYDGRVKTVRIHDLLREMSVRKAEEEMFLQHIHVPLDCNLLPDDHIYSCYRVCTSLFEKCSLTRSHIMYNDIQRLSLAPPLRSLLCFENDVHFSNRIAKKLCSVVLKFKLLRVLHFEMLSSCDDLLSDTILLVRLRYISIEISDDKLPSSLSSMVNLETLIVKGGNEIAVPVEIWEMVMLRNIHINPCARFTNPPENSSKLENLQTLSTPNVDFELCGRVENFIMRIPNVRELKCDLRSNSNSNEYPQFESLFKLESLELCTMNYDTWAKPSLEYVGNLSFPSTLKELTLSGFHLQWDQISSFKNLPSLAVLELNCGAVDGDLWELGDEDVFAKLRILKFRDLQIKQWIASDTNFPYLQKLIMQSCFELEEIPSSIGGIDSLVEIDLFRCSDSVNESAREIKEDQKDFGNDSLNVCIVERRKYVSDSDEDSSDFGEDYFELAEDA